MGLFQFRTWCLCLLLVFEICSASNHYVGKIYPGFQTSHSEWADNNGLFLFSNNSAFALCFYTALDVKLFLLVVIHLDSTKVVWTANRGLLVENSDKFIFGKNGNVLLERLDGVVWSTNTTGEKVEAMELQDSGNLVLLAENKSVLWQSFSHPTDTLLPDQVFRVGMRLKSFPNHNNLSHYLAFQSGDVVLYAGYATPQIYWSITNESRKTKNNVSGNINSVSLKSNSWNFYDQDKVLLWQLVFSDYNGTDALWAATLGSDGSISFYNLQKGKGVTPEATKIPQDSCSIPEPCDPYFVCYFENWCQCPSLLDSEFKCKPQTVTTCNSSQSSVELLYVGEKLTYFALGFVQPLLKSNLNACQEACLASCSCLVLFFENTSGRCYLFDEIGSLQRSSEGSPGYFSYMKVPSSSDGRRSHAGRMERKHIISIVTIVIATLLAVLGLLYVGFWYYRKKKGLLEYAEDVSEEDNFLSSLSGMPVRFSFSDLCQATKNFTTKVGQGGFGSVYQGVLPDGTRLAVKKLEGIGQGKKEFRAEVTTIGSIHHVHLVKLKGFCAEGSHRLLVYEFMGKQSLDKWIFKNNKGGHLLDWDTRFNIALGTAKGLAYLHEECEVKIVHCDIKPENVLLDDNFVAKVSDFGLAKLMNREQSLVYTTLRGTRGYLAPEWITNYAISEKSDVYSYGMVLLEIIGGRKNYDPVESSEKAYFPAYAFRMLEGGKLTEIVDSRLEIDENDERISTAIKVALWCIQDEMNLRPSMTKVVQMLEGISAVPSPPTAYQISTLSSFYKWSSEEGSSSGLIDFTEVLMSDVRLSGPR
ncbi:G-type lectin S-receptor-like serine/threonine-protein kinase SD2-5 [Fagus crenata]